MRVKWRRRFIIEPAATPGQERSCASMIHAYLKNRQRRRGDAVLWGPARGGLLLIHGAIFDDGTDCIRVLPIQEVPLQQFNQSERLTLEVRAFEINRTSRDEPADAMCPDLARRSKASSSCKSGAQR